MKRKAKILYILVGIVLLLEVVVLALFAFKIVRVKQYQKQMELGDRYLEEMDYEEAEICYLEAIEIDEKKVTPYINLAKLYVETEQFEEAYDILEQAEDAVAEDKQERIEKQRAKVEKAQIAASAILSDNQETDNPEWREDSESEPEIKETDFVQSGQMQEYNGTIYTVHEIDSDSGMIHVPNTWYMSEMLVYKDHIYYTNPGGTGAEETEIYRTNLDGTGEMTLLVDVDSYNGFCIYDDVLYYGTANQVSMSLDLNTNDMQETPYFFYDGNEEVWIVGDELWSGEKFCAEPEFDNVQSLPEYNTEIGILGAYENEIYYVSGNRIVKVSADAVDQEIVVRESIDTLRTPSLFGSGLYYMKSSDEYVYRYDLETENEKAYNLKSMIDEWEWGWWLTNEINGKLYFEEYVNMEDSGIYENIQFWELDLETGVTRSVGIWFES